jgi:hypothetical protein
MPQFTRQTILAAGQVLLEWVGTQIDEFALKYGLEAVAVGYSKAAKVNALCMYLLRNPTKLNDYGQNLTDAVVTALVKEAIRRSSTGYTRIFDLESFRKDYTDLYGSLSRDGFTVEGGELRRTLPKAIDLPKADDEVHVLLEQYDFKTSKGHLDQGIAAHTRGEWAGANAQFRSFIEGLFDEIAALLAKGTTAPPPGGQSRIWLGNRRPPFFIAGLNEWIGNGHGFIEGFLRRLHPSGSHPGLSDEEDSTFRLHLVLLVSRLMLRRIARV